MILVTDVFRDYGKLMNSTVGSRVGSDDSIIYLDFKDKKFYLKSGFDTYLQFNLTIEDDTEENSIGDRIMIDLKTFLIVATRYPSLCVDVDEQQNYIFSYGDDKFKIEYRTWEENDLAQEFADNISKLPEISIGVDVVRELFKSLKYVSDNMGKINCILFNNGIIRASNVYSFFESRLDDVKSGSMKLSPTIVQFLSPSYYEPDNCNFEIHGNDEKLVVIHKDFTIVSSAQLIADVPDFDGEEFVKQYDHPTFFVVEKNSFINLLKMYEFFTKDFANHSISLIMEDSEHLRLINDRGDSIADTELELLDVSDELIGKKLIVNRNTLTRAILDIEDENILIQYTESERAINVTGNEVQRTHVAFSRLIRDNDDEE